MTGTLDATDGRSSPSRIACTALLARLRHATGNVFWRWSSAAAHDAVSRKQWL
ncbi:hypothetical protein [Saccharothrix australiensis]|uniref:hypothetical protein n=1 Tax=Saccharothrix australiensis TaxID=2072 RepID=UPI0014771036|nr:hypothetical protein [Saccharothrix australiensis]